MFFTDEELTKKPKGAVGIDPSSLKRLEYDAPERLMCSDPMALPFGDEVALDTENYRNYNLIAFKHLNSGQYFFMERPFNLDALRWALSHFRLVTFNGIGYDMPILRIILKGADADAVKALSDEIILNDAKRPWLDCPFNHIDIMEVCPLKGSQKLYGARLHAERIQELPIDPHATLTEAECLQIRDYCFNDLDNLELIYRELAPHIALREDFGRLYGNIDLRSKSDAQMAEAVMVAELRRAAGFVPKKPGPESAAGLVFHYSPPAYIAFENEALTAALRDFAATPLAVGETGHVDCPPDIREKKLTIAGRKYSVGIGGLHSNEKKQAVVAGSDNYILDIDVTGYYPNLILNNKFGPAHLGEHFFVALGGMVDRRTSAKDNFPILRDAGKIKEADLLEAEAGGLKIANNGIFGKTSDPYSIVYDPANMVQITLTGQLSLVMLIERFTDMGLEVVSANTDGIVVVCPKSRYDALNKTVGIWGRETGLRTEETRYSAIYSRDVNAYFAVKTDGKVKVKGAYSDKGSALNSPLSTNPEVYVCSMAVQALLTKGTPIETTIRNAKRIQDFVSIKNATGGAYKDGYYLGKLVRWYYSTQATPGPILKCKSGHAVPDTEGAVPLMQLPPQLPSDIDLDWYIAKANAILVDIGYTKPNVLI
jgi:hypothetical protein